MNTNEASVEFYKSRIAELSSEIEDLKRTFNIRWKADRRATERWQAAHPGNDLVWPDHADLVMWLSERILKLEEALKPFASIPPMIIDKNWDIENDHAGHESAHYWCVIGHPSKTHFTREDLARARKVLLERKSDEEIDVEIASNPEACPADVDWSDAEAVHPEGHRGPQEGEGNVLAANMPEKGTALKRPSVLLTEAITDNPPKQEDAKEWLNSLPEGVRCDPDKLADLVRHDGSICTPCALTNGAVWPEGHVATFSNGICCVCEREMGTCAVSDWEWPSVKGRKAPREF